MDTLERIATRKMDYFVERKYYIQKTLDFATQELLPKCDCIFLRS